ncbi:MAG: polyketide cyclase, partial [Acidimicrobiia bacterium]
MTDENRVSVRCTITAAPDDIFAVITDPNMHVAIDGSGMLQSAPDAKPLVSVGDSFEMNMDREPLGDLPLGKYQVLNTVTKIERDETLEWNVGGLGMGAFG